MKETSGVRCNRCGTANYDMDCADGKCMNPPDQAASERDEETAFLKQFVKDYSHPEAMKIWQDGFDAGRQSMREEIKELKRENSELKDDIARTQTNAGQAYDRQEKTIEELRAALEEVRNHVGWSMAQDSMTYRYNCAKKAADLIDETLAKLEVK